MTIVYRIANALKCCGYEYNTIGRTGFDEYSWPKGYISCVNGEYPHSTTIYQSNSIIGQKNIGTAYSTASHIFARTYSEIRIGNHNIATNGS